MQIVSGEAAVFDPIAGQLGSARGLFAAMTPRGGLRGLSEGEFRAFLSKYGA